LELDYLKMRANATQERLIAASNSGCRTFTQHLNTYQADTNLSRSRDCRHGAAGGIVSVTVRLSGKNSFRVTGPSPVRAEYNSDIFAQKLVATIVQAIDVSLQDSLVKIRGSDVQEAGQPTAKSSPNRAKVKTGRYRYPGTN
jgi:hypothetical protein